ncbi:MAG: PD-(D/E)XK nuclease family protein [Pseudomonadota bacterium]
MPHLTATSSKELQKELINLADDNALVLTANSRLARRLLHEFRTEAVGQGLKGWLPPKILSLNAWLREQWNDLWPEESLPSITARLYLWEKAAKETEPPEGLRSDLSLWRSLDDAYSVIIRHRLSHLETRYASPLINWRTQVFNKFQDILKADGLLHPAFLPVVISENLRNKSSLQDRIFLIGFDSPSPIEQDLINLLMYRFDAVACRTELKDPPSPTAVALPNREEEIFWLAQELLRKSLEMPLHRIGVVIPDMEGYAQPLSRLLQQLIGAPATPERGSFNISLGGRLLDQSLVQAALLPLKFMIDGEQRAVLLSLLLSPYYGCWARSRRGTAGIDRIWREYSIDSGLDNLIGVMEKQRPELVKALQCPEPGLPGLLRELAGKEKRPQEWVESLFSLWDSLGFPFMVNEFEKSTYRKLREAIASLVRELGTEKMEAGSFYSWLTYSLGDIMVNIPAHEEAGIQIIGLVESRCLSFDQLYVAGLSERSLPQPVRSLPLLAPEERNLVQGGTIESQYRFAEQAFSHLLTLAPFVTLTRPLEDKGDPVPPSPFWPEHEQWKSVNCWLEANPALVRAGWLKGGLRGRQSYPLPFPPADRSLSPSPMPSALSVSALERAISCPFRFFAASVLGIQGLAEPILGISPLEKGNMLHRLLSAFTKRLRDQGIVLEDEKVEPVLQQCIDLVLGDLAGNPHWQVEKERWMSSASENGLVRKWIGLERERAVEGWRWIAEEVSFQDLANPAWPFKIAGRIDRVDLDPDGRIYCWDYKTGSIPSSKEIMADFTSPQLPCYLLAVRNGQVRLPAQADNCGAGYISLKLEGDVQFNRPVSDEDWEGCISAWVEEIAELGRKLNEGRLQADPKPRPKPGNPGPCRMCEYGIICKFVIKENNNQEKTL